MKHNNIIQALKDAKEQYTDRLITEREYHAELDRISALNEEFNTLYK